MKKVLLFITLLYLSLCFISCSSQDKDKIKDSDSLRSCDLKLWIGKSYNITSGSYTKSTRTLTLQAKDGESFSFKLYFDPIFNNRQSIAYFTYNGSLYRLKSELREDFYYYIDDDESFYGFYMNTTNFTNGEINIDLFGDISFYQ